LIEIRRSDYNLHLSSLEQGSKSVEKPNEFAVDASIPIVMIQQYIRIILELAQIPSS
jgi:hypothetical protein